MVALNVLAAIGNEVIYLLQRRNNDNFKRYSHAENIIRGGRDFFIRPITVNYTLHVQICFVPR